MVPACLTRAPGGFSLWQALLCEGARELAVGRSQGTSGGASVHGYWGRGTSHVVLEGPVQEQSLGVAGDPTLQQPQCGLGAALRSGWHGPQAGLSPSVLVPWPVDWPSPGLAVGAYVCGLGQVAQSPASVSLLHSGAVAAAGPCQGGCSWGWASAWPPLKCSFGVGRGRLGNSLTVLPVPALVLAGILAWAQLSQGPGMGWGLWQCGPGRGSVPSPPRGLRSQEGSPQRALDSGRLGCALGDGEAGPRLGSTGPLWGRVWAASEPRTQGKGWWLFLSLRPFV